MLFLDAYKNYSKYGNQLNTHDCLKFFAIVIMIMDHIGFFFFPDDNTWRMIGRMGFPVWFFLSGYATPKHISREILFLGAMMIAADIVMIQPVFPFNALVSICLCRLFVGVMKDRKPSLINFVVIAILLIVTFPITFSLFEYGSLGLIFALCGYYYRFYRDKPVAIVSMIVSLLFFILVQQAFFQFSAVKFLLFVVTTSLTCIWLHYFTVKNINFPHYLKPVSVFVMFMGRNSHYVYFIHFVLFEFIAYALAEPRPFHLRWFL